ncbi:MAG: 30S ribosome-binding factor RbfA [Clostridia bacterium]|nr:30S ribosome-binding factor RbfA [Clostridia bacterium]
MSNRINRINEETKKEISQLIRELKDPRVKKGLVSVVATDVSKDLSKCVVFVSVLGDEKVQNDAIAGLNSASGFVRRELGSRLKLRISPEVTFNLDHSIEYGAHINEILKGL